MCIRGVLHAVRGDDDPSGGQVSAEPRDEVRGVRFLPEDDVEAVEVANPLAVPRGLAGDAECGDAVLVSGPDVALAFDQQDPAGPPDLGQPLQSVQHDVVATPPAELPTCLAVADGAEVAVVCAVWDLQRKRSEPANRLHAAPRERGRIELLDLRERKQRVFGERLRVCVPDSV